MLAALTAELRDRAGRRWSWPAPARITLELRDGRTVVWGDADPERRDKARVATALLGRKADTIDVSAPDVVTIR